MKKWLFFILLLAFLFAFNNALFAQAVFERLSENAPKLAILLLGYHNKNDNLDVVGVGSASLYGVPVSTNPQSPLIGCIVTAKHNLQNKQTKAMFDGILLKLNMPSTSDPRYLKIPLKHNNPKNYWVSDQDLDLAAIPIPPEMIEGADLITFREDQIVTPNSAHERKITAGLIAQAICIQPDYLAPLDFLIPEVIPIVRIGHLSRIGFYEHQKGTNTIRPHVVDIHSSPGNSGATVVLYVPVENELKSTPMFLGIIQGFKEEQDAYVPYQAPITNVGTETSLTLLSASKRTKTKVAIALKTLANPNLSYVIPVYELSTLRNATTFQEAVNFMGNNKNLYEIFNTLPMVQKPIQSGK